MRVKTVPVRIKAAGTNEGTDEGVFEAIVAAYNLDSVGDKIVPGAFSESLTAWSQSGDPIPVYWSHRMDDPDYNIGQVLDARETDDGLWVRAQLDMQSPKAAQVYRLLKGRRVTQFSFAYDIEDGAYVEPADGEPYYELRKLKLHEVGPTPIGANQETELLAVKQLNTAADRLATVKAGRTLSAKNEERVRDIARLAKELLDSLADTDESKHDTGTDQKATPAQPATAEEPSGAKADVPARPGPASLRLLADLDAMCVEAI